MNQQIGENTASSPELIAYSKRTYTVNEIQDILEISRPTAYELVRKNYFHSVRLGGHIRISKRSFDEWLDNTAE